MAYNSDSSYTGHDYLLTQDLSDSVNFIKLYNTIFFLHSQSGGYKAGETVSLISQSRILANVKIEGEVSYGQDLYARTDDGYIATITTNSEFPNIKVGIATSSKDAFVLSLPSMIFDTISNGRSLLITPSTNFAYNNDPYANTILYTLPDSVPERHTWISIYGSLFFIEITPATARGIPRGTRVTLISHSKDIRNVRVNEDINFGDKFSAGTDSNPFLTMNF